MPGLSQQPRLIRFGLYEADLAARELRRDGSKVKLQDRPFEVLTILIERPGEVVGREEFRQRLWPADTFVDFDSSLNTSINKLRQALSDDAENPRFIATAGRRGYRFIAPTTHVDDATAIAFAATATPTQLQPVETSQAPSWGGFRIGIILGSLAIAGVVLILILRFLPKPVPKVLNVVQISHNEHLDAWGRVKTDGARLFFLERAGGHWNVMQVPASGGEAQLFPEPSRNTRLLDISPDRAEFLSFAFLVRGPDLPLSLTPVVGGPSRRVGDIIADDAVFGPDGRRIFFTKPDGIYSCEHDGTHVQRLVGLTGRSEDPRWSKDGRRLRFTLFEPTSNRHSIWEVSADGKNLHPVLGTLGFPGRECCGEWSADGRYFFFESLRDGYRSVWAVRDRGNSLFAPAPKPVQLTLGPHSYGSPIPDGNNLRLFVWGGDEQHDVVRYDRKSYRVEPLIPTMHSIAMDLSPDGRWLAFPSGGALWKSQPDGSQRQSLASRPGTIDGIRWSPNGRQVLFHSVQGTEFGKFCIVSSDGGTPREISLGPGNNEAGWSPDGQSIVYAKWAGDGGIGTADSGIFSLDLQSSQRTKVAGSEGMIHPIYSPDKRFVAAVTTVHLNPTQPVHLKVLDTRTHQWTEVAPGRLINPIAWSPDSKYIYYQDILGENEPVFRYAIGGTKPELFFDFANLLRAGYIRCAFVRFAPDGGLIASLTRSDTDLYRLDLDLP